MHRPRPQGAETRDAQQSPHAGAAEPSRPAPSAAGWVQTPRRGGGLGSLSLQQRAGDVQRMPPSSPCGAEGRGGACTCAHTGTGGPFLRSLAPKPAAWTGVKEVKSPPSSVGLGLRVSVSPEGRGAPRGKGIRGMQEGGATAAGMAPAPPQVTEGLDTCLLWPPCVTAGRRASPRGQGCGWEQCGRLGPVRHTGNSPRGPGLCSQQGVEANLSKVT